MKKRGIKLVRDLSICPIVKYTFRYDVRTNRLNEYSRWNSSKHTHSFIWTICEPVSRTIDMSVIVNNLLNRIGWCALIF